MKSLFQWAKFNSTILINAGSLIGTTAVTSILGFVYWWLAARQFSILAVGLASAAVSAMALLGNLSTLGLGTMLIGELGHQHGKRSSLISASLILTGLLGGVVGIVYAVVIPDFFSASKVLGTSIQAIGIFACGVSLTALTLALDQALIGLLRGTLQLYRNILFAGVKLAALFTASLLISHLTGLTIYTTWVFGNLISLLFLALWILIKKGRQVRHLLPDWKLLRRLGPTALKHHSLNLTLDAPSLILPILVIITLSATENAWFYVAWSLASIANSVSSALSVALYAVGSAQPSVLARKMRVTLGLAIIACVFANCVLLFGTKQVLSVFGSSYAEHATWSLRILSLETFPFLIKNHFITLSRIQGRIGRTTLLTIATGLFELCMSAIGAHFWGVNGVSVGWTTAISIEAIFMFHVVQKAATYAEKTPDVSVEQEVFDLDARPLVNTLVQTITMPAIKVVNAEIYQKHLDRGEEETIKLPRLTREKICRDNASSQP